MNFHNLMIITAIATIVLVLDLLLHQRPLLHYTDCPLLPSSNFFYAYMQRRYLVYHIL